MFRAFRIGLCLVAFAASAQAGVVASHGALKVKGNRIVDASGKPIQVAGMSMFWSGWMSKYWNSGVVNNLVKDWNSSLVRAAMGIEGDGNYLGPKDPKNTSDKRTDAQIKQANKDMVIAVVDAAIANDVYVIIDWHDHNANLHLTEAKTFFSEMAQKYKDSPHVIWELWNEPENTNGSGPADRNNNKPDTWAGDIKPYAEAIIPEIRKYSSNLIVVGTSTWSQDVDVAASSPLADTNTAYTLHFYAGTHAVAPNTDPKKGASLGDKARTALSKGIALFMTEWGTSVANGGVVDPNAKPPVNDNKVWTAESDAWLAFAKENSISWANWSVADKDESSAALKPNAPSNGTWTDANISPAGLYVRGKIREVTAAIPPTGVASRRSISPLGVRASFQGLSITLPENARELTVSDLQGRVEHHQILSGERNLQLDVATAGVKVIKVVTPQGIRSASVAASR